MLKEPKRIIAEEPTAQEYSTATLGNDSGSIFSVKVGQKRV